MAKTFDDLFENVKQIPWEDWLALDAAFPVSGKSQKSQLHNVPSVQAITKKAIVERMNQTNHRKQHDKTNKHSQPNSSRSFGWNFV